AINRAEVNSKETILATVSEFKQKLEAAGLDLKILPGCDFPLSFEGLQLLENNQILTINDGKRYLLLEFPDSSLPPATEEICFSLNSKGIIPIITHPERHLIFQEMPHKLRRLIDLGCLVQLTGASLTGGFGRHVARAARAMLRKGYCHILASDAHSPRSRPPLLSQALETASSLVGRERALAMVTTTPGKIIKGEPCN
ncbi:MAG: phosphotransferase, partial [Deltaproteobacteria bacterium]|nr:phosphotransferase [Deltaproteobacteria bacterium]